MEPYIEFIGTLQNSGFWLVKVVSTSTHISDTEAVKYPRRKHFKAKVYLVRVDGPSGLLRSFSVFQTACVTNVLKLRSACPCTSGRPAE